MNLIFSCNFCIFPKFLILNIFYNVKDLSENIANIKETHLYYLCGKRERGRSLTSSLSEGGSLCRILRAFAAASCFAACLVFPFPLNCCPPTESST